jgi:retinol dehydrogenase-12
MLFPPIYGAYTELYSGLSPDLTTAQNGKYIAPWGRVLGVKKDREESLKTKDQGGSGKAEMFWSWCERECGKFA